MVHHGEGLIRCASGASDREATMSGTRSRACLPTPWCGPLALTATVALALTPTLILTLALTLTLTLTLTLDVALWRGHGAL